MTASRDKGTLRNGGGRGKEGGGGNGKRKEEEEEGKAKGGGENLPLSSSLLSLRSKVSVEQPPFSWRCAGEAAAAWC